jgi:hypothetical protein
MCFATSDHLLPTLLCGSGKTQSTVSMIIYPWLLQLPALWVWGWVGGLQQHVQQCTRVLLLSNCCITRAATQESENHCISWV